MLMKKLSTFISEMCGWEVIRLEVGGVGVIRSGEYSSSDAVFLKECLFLVWPQPAGGAVFSSVASAFPV